MSLNCRTVIECSEELVHCSKIQNGALCTVPRLQLLQEPHDVYCIVYLWLSYQNLLYTYPQTRIIAQYWLWFTGVIFCDVHPISSRCVAPPLSFVLKELLVYNKQQTVDGSISFLGSAMPGHKSAYCSNSINCRLPRIAIAYKFAIVVANENGVNSALRVYDTPGVSSWSCF